MYHRLWKYCVLTAIFKMDNQQRPSVEPHETLLNVMSQPGWERSLRGEWILVYIWLSPFAIQLKLPQHC